MEIRHIPAINWVTFEVSCQVDDENEELSLVVHLVTQFITKSKL